MKTINKWSWPLWNKVYFKSVVVLISLTLVYNLNNKLSLTFLKLLGIPFKHPRTGFMTRSQCYTHSNCSSLYKHRSSQCMYVSNKCVHWHLATCPFAKRSTGGSWFLLFFPCAKHFHFKEQLLSKEQNLSGRSYGFACETRLYCYRWTPLWEH